MYLLLLFTALLLAGCAQTVEIRHDLPVAAVSRAAPVKVQVQIPPSSLRRSTTESGLVAVGVLNDWNIDLYTHLPAALGRVLSNQFQNFEVSDSYLFDCRDCGLFIRPEITDISINNITMQTNLSLALAFYDARGARVAWLEGSGRSSTISADRLGAGVAGYFVPFFGSLVGERVVRGTVEAAFEEALEDLSVKLHEEANRGALARTWLPAELLDKQQFGNQEYTAERIALDSGCDLGKDGLRLVEQQYFMEKYEAHCWAKPVFRIICEYGRCAAESEMQTHVATSLPENAAADPKDPSRTPQVIP